MHKPLPSPDIVPYPDGFHLPKADVSHITRKRLDIAYAPTSSRQKLDIYLPDGGEGPFPALMNVRGGALAMGNKGASTTG